tara:strand:+ start:164 stop:472 length:309 start_codon:yes stop_codon:yes gene_type:complete
MSAIVNFSINLEAIPKELIVKGKKGSYVNLTMFANDETKFNNNCSIAVSKSQEEREAGEPTIYLGNGKVVWVSPEGVTLAEREVEAVAPVASTPLESNDLPF